MIKRLSQCVREYKKDALLSPLYVLVESFLDVAIPFVMADPAVRRITGGLCAGGAGLRRIGGTQLRPGHGGLCPQPAP